LGAQLAQVRSCSSIATVSQIKLIVEVGVEQGQYSSQFIRPLFLLEQKRRVVASPGERDITVPTGTPTIQRSPCRKIIKFSENNHGFEFQGRASSASRIRNLVEFWIAKHLGWASNQELRSRLFIERDDIALRVPGRKAS